MGTWRMVCSRNLCARSFLRDLLLAGTAVLMLGTVATADVKLPAVIGDNMVLQQGRPLTIWGTADAGEEVTVTLGEQKQTATADATGAWKVRLEPVKAGGPWEMTVAGKNTLTLHNVLAGEVWVCSGQSNMEMAVKNSKKAWGGVKNGDKEAAAGNFPMIHLFTVTRSVAGKPQTDLKGQWVVATPQTVGEFSAAGYFFGLDLHQAIKVPVGLIATSWGGTPAEAWMSDAALDADPDLKPLADSWRSKVTEYPETLEKYTQQLTEWEKSAEEAQAAGAVAPEAPAFPEDPRANPWRTAGLWNAMIAPLTPYAIAGAIWYQGEANADYAYQYRKTFSEMIQDWRRAWNQGDFPFFFVQLASYDQDYAPADSWAVVRESQAKTLALPKTGFAVAADIGEAHDIHPKNKQEVGRRLALAAEAVAYGRKVEYSGPVFQSLHAENGTLRLRFSHLGGGLVMRGATLAGFQIAGENQKFVTAEAKIDGNDVVLSSPKVPKPVAARYAWADDPKCSLYNRAGLPAPPFRTDDWTVPTQGKIPEK